jgi:hypothetical protein
MHTKDLPAVKGRPLRMSDNLTAICEPTVETMSGLDISQPWRLPRPVTEIILFCYMYTMLVPQWKHSYWAPRPVTGNVLLFYMWMVLVPHRELSYGATRPVTGIALLFYMWMMLVPHMKHTTDHHGLLRDAVTLSGYVRSGGKSTEYWIGSRVEESAVAYFEILQSPSLSSWTVWWQQHKPEIGITCPERGSR